MTNDKTVTMSRELAEAFERENSPPPKWAVDQLRALLAKFDLVDHCKQCAEAVNTWPESKRDCLGKIAAPVVECQEPAAWIDPYAVKDLAARPNTARGVVKAKADRINGYTQPLYTSPPAPVAVVLPDLSELREYHAKAVSNLKSYADDAGLRDSDIKHYLKRAAFHADMVSLIDKVKELNQ